ncbi:calcineurin-like phosphoesterase family protein [Litoreibacter meonggei]|uniref:Calcineurin-like phosphoesterase family protein n=1 Tax=Litoreibacter meonggei TaxID=1049199 RepID=A0A497WR46_9RHOB|nr:metallophosphoesterase [Litoreibacter meonggei]RLJ51503.1 calcineurin-like phosphoesterase family protein [Litoreibacter meonggei]
MTSQWTGQVAVLADPHLHDVAAGRAYGLVHEDCFRSLADTASSTRVFNEGGVALVRALDILVEHGVRLVMIAGDLTDDGQPANWNAAASLLHKYTQKYGMRFFLTPGNHDQWYGDGKALKKGMVTRDGVIFAVAGDPSEPSAVHAPAMRQVGQAEMLDYARSFGFCRHDDDLHWETPFGASNALVDRIGALTGSDGNPVLVPDLSYLVEPVAGLWILSVDANVYLPGTDGWVDCGQQGWNAVLRHKAWLLDWMRDVAARAKVQGKQLLTMSHFPAIDLLNDVSGGLAERVMPTHLTADATTATGVGLHFSGHWHINRTGARHCDKDWLVNVAVPSTASFPAAFKLVNLELTSACIDTVQLGQVPGFDAGFAHYLAEQPNATLPLSESYADFLREHLDELTGRRYLARDWPTEFGARLERETLADILTQTGRNADSATTNIPARLAIDDYYFLERGGQLAEIPAERLCLYMALDPAEPIKGGDSQRRLIMGLARYSQALPDDKFSVDLANGSVT